MICIVKVLLAGASRVLPHDLPLTLVMIILFEWTLLHSRLLHALLTFPRLHIVNHLPPTQFVPRPKITLATIPKLVFLRTTSFPILKLLWGINPP